MKSLMSRRSFCATTLLPVAGTLLLLGCGGGGESGPTQSALAVRGHALATGAPARWAEIAMRAAALAPGLPPFITARAYAMAFLAAHDALNATLPVYAVYLSGPKAPGANPDAAVAAAVRDVLVHEFPFAMALLDTEYASALAAIAGVGSVPTGIEIGQRCAAAMLAERAGDGLAEIDGPFTEGTLPGAYRFTPPFDFAAAVHLGDKMKPFSIPSAVAFRVDLPYAVTDAAYTADYNEVKALGAAIGSSRSTDQSELGKFWLENTNDSWMKIALQLAASRQMDGWALMRTLALIQVAQADAYTACVESKYFYRFWRPITAIHLAGTGGVNDGDGNPATVGDPAWASFDPVCPPIPDYPSGHAASGGAGAVVLAQAFGSDALSFTHQSVSLPGPTRSFTSFSQAQDEIAFSRICVGYHFRLATQAGVAQGRAVAAQVMAAQLAALG